MFFDACHRLSDSLSESPRECKIYSYQQHEQHQPRFSSFKPNPSKERNLRPQNHNLNRNKLESNYENLTMMVLEGNNHSSPCPSQENESEDTSSSESTPTCETSDVCVSRCCAYGKICPANARAAARAAHEKMKVLLADSEVFRDGEPAFRRIPQSDIILGDRLGEGGFSMVYSCSLKEDPSAKNLAMKYLKRRVMCNPKTFEHGAADLVTEAFFLAKLDHPNVIKLHAITEGCVKECVSAGKERSYFIIVDRLVETLEERIDRWRAQLDKLPNGMFYRMSKDYKEKQRSLLKQRVQVALEIAKVMAYLHSQKVVFRDLKPDNVGFDSHGTLKLFDFGLAREQKEAEAVEDGNYKMTGHTGSRRYMAPEVATQDPYNQSVDVYSFGIMLWQMCALEKPFAGYSSNRHMCDVVLGGERPSMDGHHTQFWPVLLQWLMTSSWSDSNSRPTYNAIIETLEEVIAELEIPLNDRIRARSEGTHHVLSKDEHGQNAHSPTKRRSLLQWKKPEGLHLFSKDEHEEPAQSPTKRPSLLQKMARLSRS